jgi:hypothetical protein
VNSWQEDRDRLQRQPQIPAHLAIPNLESALKDGQALASDSNASRDKLDMWARMTLHWLELAFGKGEHPDSFKRAGPAPPGPSRPGPNTDAKRIRERKVKHRAQLTKLQGSIAILKQTPESSAALLSPEPDGPAMNVSNIDVFISHSALDEPLARALANLLRTALRLSSKRIRCTSVDGHTLPAGVNIAETLRQDIETSPVFLAVMTESSSESEYVRAEIGARWMTQRYAVMLVGGGYKRSEIRGPLADTHALKLSAEADLLKLVTEVAEQLRVEPESPDSLHRLVKELASLGATGRAATTKQPSQPQSEPELPDELVQVLQVFVDREDRHQGAPYAKSIAESLQIQVSDAKYRLAQLAQARMLMGDGIRDAYGLSQAGRSFIVKRRASKPPPA